MYCYRCHEEVDTRADRGTRYCAECNAVLLAFNNEPADPFGKKSHDEHYPTHSGKRGHFCWEFDGLWICEDCDEFQHCICLDD